MPERFGSNESTYDALRGQTLGLPVDGGASGADSTYLRLDTTNDPLTGPLDITVSDANALRVIKPASGGVGSFPTTSILDNFNRANEGPPPSASWQNMFDWVEPLIVSGNQAIPQTPVNGGAAIWKTAHGQDLEAYVTLSNAGIGAHPGVNLYFKIQDPATYADLYYVGVFNSGGDISLVLYSLFSGYAGLTNTYPPVVTLPTGPLESGFKVGVRMIGNIIEIYYARSGGPWVLFIGGTDESSTGPACASGYFGIETIDNDGNSTALDDFGGGTISGGTPAETIFNVNSTTDRSTTVDHLVVTVATGTAPVQVTSTTVNPNLNADMLDGSHSSAFAPSALTNAHIFVGNVSNVATDVALSNDATLSNTGALTLKNTGPGATGPIGDATHVPVVTIDAQGRVTALTSTAISANVTGTGTTNRVAKFTGASAIGDSNLIGAGAGTLTLSAANTHTATFPSASDDTLATLGVANIFTQLQTMPTINVGSSFYNANVPSQIKTVATTWTAQTGTVASSGYTITGTGTAFLTDYKVGDEYYAGLLAANAACVSAIASNVSMTVTVYQLAYSGETPYRRAPLFEIRNSTNGSLLTVYPTQVAFNGPGSGGNATQTLFGSGFTTSATSRVGGLQLVSPAGGGIGVYKLTSSTATELWIENTTSPGTYPLRLKTSSAGGYISIEPAGAERARFNASGMFQVTPLFTAAGINTVLTLDPQGSQANGDGGAIALNGKSSTTAATSMGALKWLWVDATNASRKAKLQLTAFDTAERTGLEIAADGSLPTINILGSTVGNEAGDTTTDLRWETDTEANALFVDASADKVYIGGTTNGIEIEKGGKFKALGTATWFDDVRVEPTVRSSGSKAPNYTAWTPSGGSASGLYFYLFDNAIAANEKEVNFKLQMPHGKLLGSAIHLHVHWMPTSTGSAGQKVRWGLEYSKANPSGVFAAPGAFIYATDPVSPPSTTPTQDTHYITEFADIDMTGDALSTILLCRLFRNSSDAADTFAGDVGLLYIDCHIEFSQLGSNEEYTQ